MHYLLILLMLSTLSFGKEVEVMKSVRVNIISHDIKYKELFFKVDHSDLLDKMRKRNYVLNPFEFESVNDINKYSIIFYSAKEMNGKYKDDSYGYFVISGEFTKSEFLSKNLKNLNDFLYYFNMERIEDKDVVKFLNQALLKEYNSIESNGLVLRMQAGVSPYFDQKVNDYVVRYTIYIYKKPQ